MFRPTTTETVARGLRVRTVTFEVPEDKEDAKPTGRPRGEHEFGWRWADRPLSADEVRFALKKGLM